MNKTVLVVAAHPDDEVLGCGGTIARHAGEGDAVHVVFLADGEGARGSARAKVDALAGRESAAAAALRILGAAAPIFLGLEDNRLDAYPLLDVVRPVEAVVAALAPDVVYTHHGGDLNIDHELAHRAVMTACRPLPGSAVREIYTFEVVSSTEWGSPGVCQFTPQLYVDVTAQIALKRRALEAYRAEMREAPHPRSFENVAALAAYRGASVGVAAAEAFMVMRVRR
jgi:LmbE family N-acetylglucosaminyl deacetylase